MVKISDRFQFRSTVEQKTYQSHFIVETAFPFFMITFEANAHYSLLLIHSTSFLTEKDFRSIPQNALQKENVGDFNVTIGEIFDLIT